MRVRFDAARKDLLLAVALLIGVALQAALLPMSTSRRASHHRVVLRAVRARGVDLNSRVRRGRGLVRLQ
jgi:hypothetical protein